MREELSQYLDRRPIAEQEVSVEHHIETRQAVFDLLDLVFLGNIVGGIAAFAEREGSVEHHIETRKAVADLLDLAVLVTVVGGITAFLVWQGRQTAAGQDQDKGGTEA